MTATPDKPIITLDYKDVSTYLVDPIIRDSARTHAFSCVLLSAIAKPNRYVAAAIKDIRHELDYSLGIQSDLMDIFEAKWKGSKQANRLLREDHLLAFNKARANTAFFYQLIDLMDSDEEIVSIQKNPELRKVANALAREVTHRLSGGHLDILHAVNEVAVIKFSNIS